MTDRRKLWLFVNKTPGYLVMMCFDQRRKRAAFANGVRDFSAKGRRYLRTEAEAILRGWDK